MAAYTLAEAQTELATWKTALQRLALGSSYTISTNGGSRTLTRASLPEVRSQIQYFDRLVVELTAQAAGSTRGSVVLPKWNY